MSNIIIFNNVAAIKQTNILIKLFASSMLVLKRKSTFISTERQTAGEITDDVYSRDSMDNFTNKFIENKINKFQSTTITVNSDKDETFNDNEYFHEQQQYENNFSLNAYKLLKNITTGSKQITSTSINSSYPTTNADKIDKEISLDELIVSSMNMENHESTKFLIEKCINIKKLPSKHLLLLILGYLCERIDQQQNLIKFIELCQQSDQLFTFSNYDFDHYIARLLWLQGNSVVSLSILKSSYKRIHNDMKSGNDSSYSTIDGIELAASDNVKETKRIIRSMFRNIVKEAINGRSEAVLNSLIKIATYFYQHYKDPIILVFIWNYCFLSEWFSDQKIASELFEQHKQLRHIIGNGSTMLSYNILIEHNTDAMYRLIELYLKFNMMDNCQKCLEMLFNYQYWKKDLRACSEIIQNSLDLNIPLSEVYSRKLLTLLLGNSRTKQIHESSNDSMMTTSSSKFQFKF